MKKQHLTTPPYSLGLYKNERSILKELSRVTTPIPITSERRSGNLRSIDNGQFYTAEMSISLDCALARYLVEIGKILKGRGKKYPSERLLNREKVREYLLEITNWEGHLYLRNFIDVSIGRGGDVNKKVITITAAEFSSTPPHLWLVR